MQTEVGEMTVVGRKAPASEMPFRAVLVRWIIGLGGFVLLGFFLAQTPPTSYHPLLIFVFAMVVLDLLFMVRIESGSYFSVSPTFLLFYFLVTGGVGAASLDAISRAIAVVIRTIQRRQVETPLFAFFAIGQLILANIAAAGVVHLTVAPGALTGPAASANPLASVLIFAFTYAAVNAALTSLSVYVRSGISELRAQIWPRTILWMALGVVASIPFALVLPALASSFGYVPATIFVLLLLAGISLILKLNVSLRKGNEELKAITRVGSLLTATLELDALFRIVAVEIRRVLEWDAFFIATTDKSSPRIDIVFMTGTGDEVAKRNIPRGAGLTGKVIETGELIYYERGDRDEALDEEDTLRGQRRPRSIVVAPMKFGDDVIGALCVQSFRADIYGPSQIRLLQTIAAQAAIATRNAQLFRSEQEAKSERDEFLSLVTHEIKNPVTSIKGYAELAESSVGANDSAGALDSIKVIRGEAQRILRLAEDLLDASKMSASKFKVEFTDVNLAEIVSEIATRYATTSQRSISVEAPPDLEPITGDSVRLAQVVENLISNAVKYSPADSRIDIRINQAPATVWLEVRDRGIGVPPEKLDLIFERFYRVEENGKVVKGTGLGLFISREIVRMHGGAIRVASRTGEGSVFTVELPKRRASE